MLLKKYDIIVVGAGHAGCEAASAAATLGSSVLLITMNLNLIAQMSCNPSIGGVAKGQIIREIDALGGMTGIITDETMIQFRMLNRSKGPAMWSPRAQCDRKSFSDKWRLTLEKNKNIDFWQDSVREILFKENKVIGVITLLGIRIFGKAVILAAGTFLNGLIHIGEKSFQGGRMGENASQGLTDSLVKAGFVVGRLKTGTPARVDGRTINFSVLEEQLGDLIPSKFSFSKTSKLKLQKSCYLAYTNIEVHDILKTGFERSPLFSGTIKGRGPRYCPSIEDKIVRFSEKTRHQLFVEPEGWNSIEYYINGFSSSLSEEIQLKALRKVSGFEKIKMFRPGYAIEYDYFSPNQLNATLETKLYSNLYFSGQINGTTGYEEAAAQGLVAGINAHNKISNKTEFILNRSEAYIGVLIDDLVTKNIDEPYRMFTSRAEYRILLRQDNADMRLTPIGYSLGLIGKHTMKSCMVKSCEITKLITFLKNTVILPNQINNFLISVNTPIISQKTKISTLLLRPQLNIKGLLKYSPQLLNYIEKRKFISKDILEEVEILIKYQSYIEKEKEIAEKIIKLEQIKLKLNFNYNDLKALSIEAREKLNKIKPETIGQASRISGVSPADITILLVNIGR
ncbi:MAG: tRNA uridine-5-carboxymethylaminomethyl(34) synthesis enzyme MnmG [Bacteroidota bacterium]